MFESLTAQVQPPPPPPNILLTFLLLLLCLIGFLGNLLICMAIWLDRRLHNVTNYFLFSLALADLFVCTVVMPLSVYVEIRHGKWDSDFPLCLVYVYADVFLCTASIVHMSVISLDRYLGISKPLEMRNRSKTMISIKITLVWTVTVVISSPIAIVAVYEPTNILAESQCVIRNRYYMIYGSTFAFLIPFVIMAVTYVKTTNLLNKQASLLSQTATQRTKGEGLRRTLPRRPTNSSFLNGGSRRVSNANERYSGSRLSVPMINSEDELNLLDMLCDENGQNKETKLRKLCVRTSSVFTSITSRFGNQHTQKAEEIANEHKATRVLAVVFGCFFVCWTPFFAVNFATGFLGPDKLQVPDSVGSFLLWLGYVSSIINPLIYTVFNRTNIERMPSFLALPRNGSEPWKRSYLTLPQQSSVITNEISGDDKAEVVRSTTPSLHSATSTAQFRDRKQTSASETSPSRSLDDLTLNESSAREKSVGGASSSWLSRASLQKRSSSVIEFGTKQTTIRQTAPYVNRLLGLTKMETFL